MNKNLPFLFLSCLLVLVACEDEPKHDNTFFGGQVVNPVEDYITIAKDDKILDTVYLDEENNFSYDFPEKHHGLFTFKHAPESQLFYIEKGDSLMVRVNTVEFDESIMYSAEGSGKNNFLMEMYLLNEKNNDLIFSYYKIKPEEFAKKTDSIKKIRDERLATLEDKYDFSDEFIELAHKTIDYEFYDLRERYSFLVNKYLKDYRNEFPEDFFDYRKKVNFNDKELQSHYIYQRFLDNYLKNRSIEYCINNKANRDCFSLNNVNNLERRLKIADSIFTLAQLKYRFIGRFGRKEIIYSENKAQIDSTVELLKQFNLPKDLYTELTNLAEIQQAYFVGNSVADKKILNSKLDKIEIGDIIKRPTIIFTWSVYSTTHHKLQHKIVNELRNRYPEIDFIGMNLDQGEPTIWLKAIENYGYNTNFEYQIRDRGIKNSYFRNYLNRTFFINRDSKITYGQVQLDSPDLEQKILEFLNQ
ncbi:TlpA family protein disulfide reductase [Mesonia maritima]|uniref:Thioredoxin domain-containing protein n=1 Tax=Mesonia maritima TaxID=1793873 RepID=A0ABU1K411_9FLAO|nr:hypothetical protein [Mesonia maritima]MDR6300353.1 hypothetical protein [Mesonia maritima]